MTCFLKNRFNQNPTFKTFFLSISHSVKINTLIRNIFYFNDKRTKKKCEALIREYLY